MTSFEQLKKNRSSSLAKLTEQLDKMNSKGYQKDDNRYWKPTKDASGNAFAIIRFLSAPQNEEEPLVKIYSHGFQGPTGQYYIENSRNTLNLPDPVGELNSKLYNSSKDPESPARKQAGKQSRKTHFISNVYIIKDSGNPEAEGKVFLFKYGKKIFDKLNSLRLPEFEDETPVDPFNMWEGANFRLKMREVENYPNYDKSEFDKPSALFDTDEEIEAVWSKAYSLQEEISESKFKSYDVLKARLNKVLGITDEDNASDVDEKLDITKYKEEEPPKQKELASKPSVKETVVEEEDEDDDDLAIFAKLAKDS